MGYFNAIPDENIWLDHVFKFIIDIILVVLFALLLIHFFGYDIKATGNSMEDTIKDGNVLLLDRFDYQVSNPKQYDVIAFDEDPNTEGVQLNIKRIIAGPDDSIIIKNGEIYVNDKNLKITEGKNAIVNAGFAKDELTLGPDEYFVIGDNWNNSEDSRFPNVGNVNKSQIIGKVYLRVAPFAKIGLISQEEIDEDSVVSGAYDEGKTSDA